MDAAHRLPVAVAHVLAQVPPLAVHQVVLLPVAVVQAPQAVAFHQVVPQVAQAVVHVLRAVLPALHQAPHVAVALL